MRCDHCGTPCTKRHPVVIDRAVAMVGSDCARKFPRARTRDLIRDMGPRRDLHNAENAIMDWIRSVGATGTSPFFLVRNAVVFEIKPWFEGISLSFIKTLPGHRGTGEASRALDELLSFADKHGVQVTGTVDSQKDTIGRTLTNKELMAWYERHGFKRQRGGGRGAIVYKPAKVVRDLATYYKRYTVTREPSVETSGAFTTPWSLERFLSNYSGHGWERKKQSKKEEKSYGDRYAKRYGSVTYEIRVPSGLVGAMRGITVHLVPTKFPHGVEFETAYPLVAKHLDVEGLTMDDIERVVQELVQKYKELAKPRKRFQPDPERVSYKPRSHTYLDEDLQGKAAVDAWKKDVEDTIASILKNAGRQSITTGSVVGDVLDNHGVMMDGVSGNKQKRMVESILGSMARRRIIHRFTDAKRIEWKWRDPSDDSASTSGTRRKKPEKLAIVDVEKAIGVPVQEWPGRCHEISRRIVESGLVDGVAVYGHFRGGVSEGSMFERRRPFQRHGWVLLKGGRRILDPTRWVFEATEPYLYVGPLTDEYDEGGQQLRQQLATPPPPFNPTQSKFQLVLTPAVWKFVLGLLRYNDKTLSAQQVMWLASLPLPTLGRHAKPIFEAVEQAGLRAFIPVDNYRKVLQ